MQVADGGHSDRNSFACLHGLGEYWRSIAL